MIRDQFLALRAMNAGPEQDYESLLANLTDDLQVVHTVPLQQVKPVADRWREAIQKEVNNLFETGTLRKIKMTEAKKMEAEGRLRLVPSKGVFTLKPPAVKGGRFKRKYRLVLCGNFVDPNDSYGSLYAGGVSAESLRAILSATTRRGWKGATTDITSAFIQAVWPEDMPMYAVVPPRLLQELQYAEEGEAWLVLRPLYGLRESPAIWSAYRNSKLKALEIVDGRRRIILQQSKTDPELWFAINKEGEEEAHGSLLALLITYVDDLFYVGPERLVRLLHEWVSGTWPCSDLQWASAPEGIRYLGMEIYQRNTGEYAITQRGYIMDLIRAHDLLDKPQTLLPCPKEWVTDEVDPEPESFAEGDLRFAQRLVGEQLWLAMRCRPDIHYIVSYMASWVARHPLRVTRIALRVLAYLHKTANMQVILGQPTEVPEEEIDGSNSRSSKDNSNTASSKQQQQGFGFGNLNLVGFSDASFAPFGDRSYGASLVTVEDSPVAWRCGKQGYVMLSIMESELYQATEAALLLENVATLIDEMTGCFNKRSLRVDNCSVGCDATRRAWQLAYTPPQGSVSFYDSESPR